MTLKQKMYKVIPKKEAIDRGMNDLVKNVGSRMLSKRKRKKWLGWTFYYQMNFFYTLCIKWF